MDPYKLISYIYFYLQNLKTGAVPTNIENETYSLNDMVASGDIRGTISVIHYRLEGLDTIENTLTDNTAEEEEADGSNKFCVNLKLNYFKMSTEYVADIGIANEVPIYGEGTFSFAIKDVSLKTCGVMLNFTQGRTRDIDVRAKYRYQPIEFTGFMKHKTANNILQGSVNVANILFAYWMNYKPETASCLISPIIQYFSDLRKGFEQPIQFNVDCLKGSIWGSLLKLFEDLFHADEKFKKLEFTIMKNTL